MELPNPSREAKFSGVNGDREIFIFPVQLTTSRIGNLTRFRCDDHTYIHIYTYFCWPCAGGLSAVNAIGTQLRNPIKSGLIR